MWTYNSRNSNNSRKETSNLRIIYYSIIEINTFFSILFKKQILLLKQIPCNFYTRNLPVYIGYNACNQNSFSRSKNAIAGSILALPTAYYTLGSTIKFTGGATYSVSVRSWIWPDQIRSEHRREARPSITTAPTITTNTKSQFFYKAPGELNKTRQKTDPPMLIFSYSVKKSQQTLQIDLYLEAALYHPPPH